MVESLRAIQNSVQEAYNALFTEMVSSVMDVMVDNPALDGGGSGSQIIEYIMMFCLAWQIMNMFRKNQDAGSFMMEGFKTALYTMLVLMMIGKMNPRAYFGSLAPENDYAGTKRIHRDAFNTLKEITTQMGKDWFQVNTVDAAEVQRIMDMRSDVDRWASAICKGRGDMAAQGQCQSELKSCWKKNQYGACHTQVKQKYIDFSEGSWWENLNPVEAVWRKVSSVLSLEFFAEILGIIVDFAVMLMTAVMYMVIAIMVGVSFFFLTIFAPLFIVSELRGKMWSSVKFLLALSTLQMIINLIQYLTDGILVSTNNAIMAGISATDSWTASSIIALVGLVMNIALGLVKIGALVKAPTWCKELFNLNISSFADAGETMLATASAGAQVLSGITSFGVGTAGFMLGRAASMKKGMGQAAGGMGLRSRGAPAGGSQAGKFSLSNPLGGDRPLSSPGNSGGQMPANNFAPVPGSAGDAGSPPPKRGSRPNFSDNPEVYKEIERVSGGGSPKSGNDPLGDPSSGQTPSGVRELDFNAETPLENREAARADLGGSPEAMEGAENSEKPGSPESGIAAGGTRPDRILSKGRKESEYTRQEGKDGRIRRHMDQDGVGNWSPAQRDGYGSKEKEGVRERQELKKKKEKSFKMAKKKWGARGRIAMNMAKGLSNMAVGMASGGMNPVSGISAISGGAKQMRDGYVKEEADAMGFRGVDDGELKDFGEEVNYSEHAGMDFHNDYDAIGGQINELDKEVEKNRQKFDEAQESGDEEAVARIEKQLEEQDKQREALKTKQKAAEGAKDNLNDLNEAIKTMNKDREKGVFNKKNRKNIKRYFKQAKSDEIRDRILEEIDRTLSLGENKGVSVDTGYDELSSLKTQLEDDRAKARAFIGELEDKILSGKAEASDIAGIRNMFRFNSSFGGAEALELEKMIKSKLEKAKDKD